MGRYAVILISVLAVLTSLASCGGLRQPSPKVDLYTLEYPPPSPGGGAALPRVIRVDRFSAAPPYTTGQILFRERSYELGAYAYHRWRNTPADLVSYFLARDLKHSALFQAVLPHDTGQAPSHVLEGSVDEFFEQDHDDTWEAVLTFSITLIKANEPDVSRRILFQKTYQGKHRCARKNPRALAEAMSLTMAKLSEAVIRDVYEALNR